MNNKPQVYLHRYPCRRHFHVFVLSYLLFLSLGGTSLGEVLYARDQGFGVKYSVEISRSPAAVYEALVNAVASWWDSSHTFSGDSRNLSIEGVAGGCFCERTKEGLSVQHAQVLFARPGHMLRMKGALGPLQELSVDGILTIQLIAGESKTRLELTYRVAGYQPEGLGPDWAKAVDAVLSTQMNRLKDYLESL
ncbi:MAG TPA: SRPBCC domain-containing protein [Acidobacteriota bacterium]|nr:SRPBCC domain-containing protein [Acidobacteriota bacterium]